MINLGTEIITDEDCENTNTNLRVKKFWGGKDRGVCFSLMLKNVPQDHLEITEKEMLYMISKILQQKSEALLK